MTWEFIGKQELGGWMTPKKKGYTYPVGMWRTPVPGGWLLMTMKAMGMDPQPTTSFYPDPDHIWQPNESQDAARLLRPVSSDEIPP